MSTIYEKQHDVAAWIVRQSMSATADSAAVINLRGAVGSGKSTVLRLAAQALRQRDVTALLLTAPAGTAETAAIVLAEAADGLAEMNCLNGESEILRDPKQKWIDKFRAITERIDREPNRFVLLCDEPSRWVHQTTADPSDLPTDQTRMLADWVIEGTRCRRVISGYIPSGTIAEQTKAPRVDDGRILLRQRQLWGNAADLAEGVATAARRDIESPTVMELRLLVAYAWLFSPANASIQIDRDTTSLLEEILDGLEQQAQHAPEFTDLCRSITRLAVARIDVDVQTFTSLTSTLSPLARDVLRNCFCEEWPDRIQLHPLVRHEAAWRARDRGQTGSRSAWRIDREVRESVHDTLFSITTDQQVGVSWRRDVEALYHGVLSRRIADAGADDRLHFIEQLHEIGRSLSYMHHQHDKAAEVFRIAVSLDQDNAYSHHYLAFNLDWQAISPKDVERHYQKAIELQPEHPWWWSRWISYLATRGQFKRAGQQWRDALDALSVTEDATPDWVYLSLHRWVARWMLHWANLDLAENILRSIPEKLSSEASLARLNDMLVALRHAEEGLAAFPLSVPASQWWTAHPHTDLPLVIDGQRLERWVPARISYVDDERGLSLMTASPSEFAKDGIQYDELDLDSEAVRRAAIGFKWDDLEEGRYIELGYYGKSQLLRIGLHSDEPLADPNLLPLAPPPDRWYRRAVRESWKEMVGGDE